jgi:RNA polymerase sigma-70 factor, ECF subfamily
MAKNFRSLSDVELVSMLSGNKADASEAFRVLYDRYSSIVHAYCVRVTGDEDKADDIFQDTFIKFYQKVQPDVENTNIPGFLMKIARNLCLNAKRDKKNTIDIDEVDYYVSIGTNYEQKELLDLITRSLDLLEDDYREAFVLREYSGLSYEEIAEVTGISLGNAKSRVFRAKQKIKSILNPYLKDISMK